MSALGQKRTFAVQNVMSALPRKSGHSVASQLECPLWANIPVYRDSNFCSTTVEARDNISYRRIGG